MLHRDESARTSVLDPVLAPVWDVALVVFGAFHLGAGDLPRLISAAALGVGLTGLWWEYNGTRSSHESGSEIARVLKVSWALTLGLSAAWHLAGLPEDQPSLASMIAHALGFAMPLLSEIGRVIA